MQNIKELLDAIVQSTTFDVRGMRTLSSAEFRVAYSSQKGLGQFFIGGAKPKIPQDLLAVLTHKIRPLLSSYVNPTSDRIGNGLAHLMGGRPMPLLEDFVRDLVRAAVILGAERVILLLMGWIKGEPFRYREMVLLSGVTVDKPLALEEEIKIIRLPASSNDLPAYVPPGISRTHVDVDFLNGVVLSIDCTAEPTFYMPPNGTTLGNNFKRTWAKNKIPNFSLHSFCEALSLSCNHCISWRVSWHDYGDLQEFNAYVLTGSSFTDIPSFRPTTQLIQNDLEQARDYYLEYHASGAVRPRLGIAISRWIKSKQSESSMNDQFIDLRIALEALYLKNETAEMSFRLATYGAWHTGADFAARRERYKTLREAYSRASKAVHAGVIENTPDNQTLLSVAQDICRDGILKRLYETEEPNWSDMALGPDL